MRYLLGLLILNIGCATSHTWQSDNPDANWHKDYGYCQMQAEMSGQGMFRKQTILNYCLRSEGWYAID